MGSLKLPPSGTVYIDTQSLIYTIEPNPTYFGTLRPLWAAVGAGQLELATSELTILEVLVGPYKSGNTAVETAYEQLFASGVMRLAPTSPAILRSAARLRATVPKLRTPDAIHAGTALATGVALFVTNDFAFRSVPGLTVEVLDDVLAQP